MLGRRLILHGASRLRSSRRVPACARSRAVPRSPARQRWATGTLGMEASHSCSWFARSVAVLVRSTKSASCCSAQRSSKAGDRRPGIRPLWRAPRGVVLRDRRPRRSRGGVRRREPTNPVVGWGGRPWRRPWEGIRGSSASGALRGRAHGEGWRRGRRGWAFQGDDRRPGTPTPTTNPQEASGWSDRRRAAVRDQHIDSGTAFIGDDTEAGHRQPVESGSQKVTSHGSGVSWLRTFLDPPTLQ